MAEKQVANITNNNNNITYNIVHNDGGGMDGVNIGNDGAMVFNNQLREEVEGLKLDTEENIGSLNERVSQHGTDIADLRVDLDEDFRYVRKDFKQLTERVGTQGLEIEKLKIEVEELRQNKVQQDSLIRQHQKSHDTSDKTTPVPQPTQDKSTVNITKGKTTPLPQPPTITRGQGKSTVTLVVYDQYVGCIGVIEVNIESSVSELDCKIKEKFSRGVTSSIVDIYSVKECRHVYGTLSGNMNSDSKLTELGVEDFDQVYCWNLIERSCIIS